MHKRTCRTCGDALKSGFYHRHYGPRLAMLLFWSEVDRFAWYRAADAAYRAARRETEVA